MKIKWLSALPMIFAVMFIALPSWAGTQLWDFEKAEQEKEWTVANGKWKIDGGVYQETSGGEAAMHTLIGEEDWDDYTVEAKIRIDDAGQWAGLVFRAQSEFEYYIYYLNVPDNIIELWRHKKGGFDARDNIRKVPATKVKINNDEWYDVKVTVEGDQFELFINDESQGGDKDNTYKTGKVGVWAWQSKASFDDFTVNGDNIKNTLAVDPRRKLAITWGKLKQTN